MTRYPAWLSLGWWPAGAVLMLMLGSGVAWGVPGPEVLWRAHLLFAGCLGAYGVSVMIIRQVEAVDIGIGHCLFEIGITTLAFGVIAVTLFFAEADNPRGFLPAAAVVTAVWLIIGRTLRQRFHPHYKVRGNAVHDDPQASEHLTGRLCPDCLQADHLANVGPRPLYRAIKRFMDLSIVLASSPFAIPVVCLTAVAIKWDSPGPVFFVQPRIGQGGNRFPMVKFRSMRVDADKAGPRFAQATDERITRVGHFIRRTRIDELPQFWNVLKGEMSVIGPRPEQVAFAEAFEQSIPFYAYRHLVKPGITGWAQVTLGYVDSEDETRNKLACDLYYARHCSIGLDLVITMRTFRTLVTGDGG